MCIIASFALYKSLHARSEGNEMNFGPQERAEILESSSFKVQKESSIRQSNRSDNRIPIEQFRHQLDDSKSKGNLLSKKG